MWLLFAGMVPIVDSLRNVTSKRASKRVDSLLVSWFNNLVPLVVFTPVWFLVDLNLNQEFFVFATLSGIINAAAAILYHRAIMKGDVSEVVPMTAFTPMFLLFTSPIFVGEFPDWSGVTGVVLITLGSYLLNVHAREGGDVFAPIKALLKKKSTRYMLVVAFIWAFSANFDKRAIQAASVWQYIAYVNVVIVAIVTVFILTRKKINLTEIRAERGNLLLVGGFTVLAFVFQMTALSMTLVAYVIALKRTSGMISAILGHFIFKEERLRERLLGAAIMFAGVLFIVL
jgi:uncharacterized membrane protein